MTYVDGFLAAVPTARRDEFKAHAEKFAAKLRQHGALKVVECWGDDVPEGQLTSFPMAVKRQPDETVVFSWIEWPSAETRKTAWDKLRSDQSMQPHELPFDGKRMVYGGFKPIMEA